MRKPIQISTSINEFTECSIAICDDGTIWRLSGLERDKGWQQLPPIPQDVENEERAFKLPDENAVNAVKEALKKSGLTKGIKNWERK